MPKFKKNPSPFMMKGMSFKEGQAPMKSILGELSEAWNKLKDSEFGKKLSAGLSAAGDKMGGYISEGEIIDTRTASTQSTEIPEITASGVIPSELPEPPKSPVTKKSPTKDYKKGYYGIK